MGIWRPFVQSSPELPRHWFMTEANEKPLHNRTPISRYCPRTLSKTCWLDG